MKKILIFVLALALCLPCFSSMDFDTEAATASVYTIVTNPGENSRTQMNISWHADYTCTGCYVEYTTASDTAFALSKTTAGTYNSSDYLWFYNRNYGKNGAGYNTTKFLNYGANLTGLTPNTNYIYRIADGNGGFSETYAFKTAGAENFSIMWTSDMHITTNSYEPSKVPRFNATTEYLEKIAGYEIGLHYNAGDATNCGDRLGFWQTLYDTPVFKKYAYASTVGNHDLFDSMMDDDANYTQYWKTGKYFGIVNNYPKNAYTSTSSLISGWLSSDGYSSYASKSAEELISVSSGTHSGKQITGAVEDLNGRHYWFNYGGVLFIVFDYYSMTYTADADKAFEWATGVIDANYGKYDYLVVSEHIYLFTAGSCTNKNYSKYRDFLDANNVDFFLCGDEHAYFRTGAVYNGSNTTTANKGTVILQAPAITCTDSITTLTGSVGLGKKRYSKAGYMGGCVFDVTPDKITLKVAVSPDGTASGYYTLETVSYTKKSRYREPDSNTVVETGLYTAQTALTVYETYSSSAQALTTIPAGTVIQVNSAKNEWGRVRYNGYTGWVNLTDYTVGYATSDVTAPQAFAGTAYNVGLVDGDTMNIYTPEYGSTIANGGWSFAYNSTVTAVRDSTGAYKVTAQNTASGVAKSDTAIPTNGCVLLLDEEDPNYDSIISTLTVGNYFTVDKNKLCVYTATPGEANKTYYLPGTEPATKELVVKSDSEYKDDGTYLSGVKPTTSVGDVIAAFDNEDVRVTDASGNSVDANSGIGTGCVISLYVDGAVVDSTVVIITGDTNGDGGLTASDYIQISAHVSGNITLEDAFSKSADANADSSISPSDIAMLMAHINGTAYMY